MLDFRRSRSQAPNPFSKASQRRILLLVGSLGMIVLLMVEASKPANWAWIGDRRQAEKPVANVEVAADTRIPATQQSKLPDAFTLTSEREFTPPPGTQYFPGVKPDLFGGIRDNAHFRTSEHDAFFNLLEVLRTADAGAINAGSQGRVDFVQLFQQPDAYRGELVTIAGGVRRAERVDAAKNDAGVDHYFQLWIRPQERDDPVVVYALELPADFPQEATMNEPVTITGFFFKRWAYAAGDGIRVAPLLLAKTVDWTPSNPLAEAPTPNLAGVLVIAVFVGAVAVAALGMWMSRRRVTFQMPSLHKQANATTETLAELEQSGYGTTVAESLAQLEKSDNQADASSP